jgi:hypothetical protein
MTESERVLSTLTNLCAEDRAWIVSKLSIRQRQALMDLANGESRAAPERSHVSPPPVSADKGASNTKHDVHEALRRAKPGEIFALLHGEPAWFVAAVLALEEWPWKQELLEMLPPPTRSSVLQVTLRPVPEMLRKLLVERCVESLSNIDTNTAHETKSAWLERFRALLLDRRLAIRS